MPPHPPKRGSLFIVPTTIRPQLVRTGIEVSFLEYSECNVINATIII